MFSVGSKESLSLRALYEAECSRSGCKRNTAVLQALPNDTAASDSLRELDLSRNVVGKNGIGPVIAVAAAATKLERLVFRDNYLQNENISQLVQVLKSHPSLTYLDLSNNPISHTAGKELSAFVLENPVIEEIVLAGTLINAALVRIIQSRAQSNRVRRHPSLVQIHHRDSADGASDKAAAAEPVDDAHEHSLMHIYHTSAEACESLSEDEIGEIARAASLRRDPFTPKSRGFTAERVSALEFLGANFDVPLAVALLCRAVGVEVNKLDPQIPDSATHKLISLHYVMDIENDMVAVELLLKAAELLPDAHFSKQALESIRRTSGAGPAVVAASPPVAKASEPSAKPTESPEPLVVAADRITTVDQTWLALNAVFSAAVESGENLSALRELWIATRKAAPGHITAEM